MSYYKYKNWLRNHREIYIPFCFSYAKKIYEIKRDQMMLFELREGRLFTVSSDGKFLLINATLNKTIRSRRGKLTVTGSVLTIRINVYYSICLLYFLLP